MSDLREVPESDLPPVITIDVRLEQDGEDFIVTPLGETHRQLLQEILDDDVLRTWHTGGASVDRTTDKVTAASYYLGGEEVRIRYSEHSSGLGWLSTKRIMLCYSDDTDSLAAERLRYANFYGACVFVHQSSTVDRIVLEPKTHCKVCKNKLGHYECEWRICDLCAKKCEHSYVEGIGRSDGRLVQMTFCSKCGRPDPIWKPAHAVANVVSSL